mgnify:CR=1 FL=1
MLQATDYWQELTVPLVSTVIRVSYTGNIPDSPSDVRGFLRLRYGVDTFSARWYRLYPKTIENEVYTLVFDLIPGPNDPITLQFRKWTGRQRSSIADWAIKVEQLRPDTPPPVGVQFIFGVGQGLTRFGPENTVFQ